MGSNIYYKIAAENRKARFDYHIIEVYKAGMVLSGSEVKSIRLGKINLSDGFGRVEKGEIWLYGLHISPYSQADQKKIDPIRPRKALLQKQQILKLIGKVTEKGLTLIPLKVYFEGNWAKVDLALAKSKKKYEKRESLRRKTVEREIEKAFRGKGYGRKNRQSDV